MKVSDALGALPAAVSVLLLAAHFGRSGNWWLLYFCMIFLVLLVIRRWWALMAVRLFLGAGSLLWLITLWRLAALRRAQGEPWGRLAVILGGVALFTALSAWLVSPTRVCRFRPKR